MPRGNLTSVAEPVGKRTMAPRPLIDPRSLSATVDAVNQAVFFGDPTSAEQRRDVARWIAARQGRPGAYGQLFAGFPLELASGIRLFTGERVTSASARHILGEESCRALLLLKSDDPTSAAALSRATAWITERVETAASQAPRNNAGVFCCGKCTVGLWRNILAGGLDRRDERLRLGLAKLRSARDGKGEWRTFPFWYSVLALTEMDGSDARSELRYASARLRAEAKRDAGASPCAKRRNALARAAVERL